MTGKRQSKDNVSRARRSAPDLGQKEAKLEKTSAEELRHMEGGDVAKSPAATEVLCESPSRNA